MQDALPSDVLSVLNDEPGSVALFANWFKEGREEALVIDTDGRLTYVERSTVSPTGWQQSPVLDSAGNVVPAGQVVVAVHLSGEVWAFCTAVTNGQPMTILRLALSGDGQNAAWQVNPADGLMPPFPGAAGPAWDHIGVSYTPGAGPLVFGGSTGVRIQSLSPITPSPGQSYSWQVDPYYLMPAVYPQGRVVGAGYRSYSLASKNERLNMYYIQQGNAVYRLDFPLDNRDPGSDPVDGFSSFAGPLAFTQSDSQAWAPQTEPVPGLGNDPQMSAEWLSLGSHAANTDSQPITAALVEGQIYVFQSTPTAGKGWHRVPLTGVGARTWGAPAQVEIAVMPGGDYRMIGRGLDNCLYYYDPAPVQTGSEQTVGWTPVPATGLPESYPIAYAAMAFTGAVAQVLAVADGKLYATTWTLNTPGPQAWTTWVAVPGSPAAVNRVSMSAMSDGYSVQMVATTSQDIFHTVRNVNAAWPTWNPLVLGGTPADPNYGVSIAVTLNDRAQLVGVNVGRVVHTVRNPDGSWQPQGWAVVPGQASGTSVRSAGIAKGISDQTYVLLRGSGTTRMVSDDVRQFCGVWNVPDLPHDQPQGDVGCLYLNSAGDLVAGYLSPDIDRSSVTGSQFVHFPVVGLEFLDAHVWQDVGGALHVYGRGAGGDLQVLHQTGWQRFHLYSGPYDRLIPTWTQATVDKAAGSDPLQPAGFTTTVSTGLRSGVVAYWLDAYPDYKPSQLVQASGVPDTEAFSILTQDVTSTAWTDDTIRLAPTFDPQNPAKATQPHLVSRYVAQATLLDLDGQPMPNHPVTITGEELTEVHLHGVSYLVGPGKTVAVSTDGLGSLTVSTDADSLAPARVTLNTDALTTGTTIDLGSGVNAYLAGTGTLPSQQGAFSADALRAAKVPETGDNLVTNPNADLDMTVAHCATMYAMARGDDATMTADLVGCGTPQPIIAYVFQNWDPDRPHFQAFRTQEELDAYRSYRDNHPAYGGFWDDFVNWAGDVWEGIKSAATAVAEVFVQVGEAIVEIAIWVGNAIVSLGNMVIDAIEAAVRAVEAVFQMVVGAIMRLIEWLKALFSFHDIWNTKEALKSGLATTVRFALSTLDHFQDVSGDWFTEQEQTVRGFFGAAKARFGDTRVADAQNKVTPITDASGGTSSTDSMRNDPQANWFLSQSQQELARNPEAFEVGSPLLPGIEDPDGPWNQFMEIWQGNDIGSMLERAITDVAGVIANVFDPDQPDVGNTSIVLLLDACENLIVALLEVARLLVTAFFGLASFALEQLNTMLFEAKVDGFLNLLYRWIQTEAGAETIDDLTVGDGLLLIAAFMMTILHKLVFGVDTSPFAAGGTYVDLPAPSWVSGVHRQLAADDWNPTLDTSLVHVQGIGNLVAAFATTFFAGATDATWWAPGTEPPPLSPFIVKGNAFFAFFGCAVMATPALYGATEEALPWILWVAWLMLTAPGLLSAFSSLPLPGGTTFSGVFKNFDMPSWSVGAMTTTFVGVLILALSVANCLSSDAEGTVWAAAMLAPLSSADQFVRWIARHLPPEGEVLNFLVTIFNGIANFLCFLLPATDALRAVGRGPRITGGSLPELKVGMYCDYQVPVDKYGGHGDRAEWGWRQTGGTLPDALELDAESGRIQGAPLKTTDAGTVSVQCRDAFSPPVYSGEVALSVPAVQATPVGRLVLYGGDLQSAAGGTVFATRLAVRVLNGKGEALPGAFVTFTVDPGANGATAAFTTADGESTVCSDVTNDAGIAEASTLTAGGIAGDFTVTAAVPGVADAEFAFHLKASSHEATGIAPTVDTPSTASADVNTTFPALSVTVTDSEGKGVANVNVTFTVSPSKEGALASFGGGGYVRLGTTAADGTLAVPELTANGVAGRYTLTAEVKGFDLSTDFQLVNVAPVPTTIEPADGNTGVRNVVAGRPYGGSLAVVVRDAGGRPYPGVTVTYAVVPGAGGAGATFTNKLNPGQQDGTYTDVTDPDGVAAPGPLNANQTGGRYEVSATVANFASVATAFTMNNVDG